MPADDQVVHDKLQAIAEGVAADIRGDHPEADVDYNMYIEDLDGVTTGVIDMGDSWSSVFVWGGGEWHMTSEDAYVVETRILRKRGAL